MPSRLFLALCLTLLVALLWGCAAGDDDTGEPVAAVQVSPSPTSTPAPVATHIPTTTPAPAATDTPAATPTPAPTQTPSPTPTITPTPTATPFPGPTPDGFLRTARVPILMYHYISQPPADAHPYRVGNSVAPERFAAHLDYLAAEGYTTILLKDLLSYLAAGFPELPDKPIVLSFDDGYVDAYLNAFPALVQRGMIGTFFIITDFATNAATDPAYAYYATWEQLRQMAAAGMEIASHSRNHPDLAGKDLDYLVWQALGSMETIEAHMGEHPRVLAYPAGSYDQLVIDVFHSAHFWGAVTTQQGLVHSSERPFELKRLRISDTTGVPELAALLAYDWPE